MDVKKARDLAADDPDYSNRDLFNAIANGNHPTWTLYIQVMTFEEAAANKFNPFDITKVWSHADYPLIPVGKLVLNRNPTNYFADIEQIAFSPAHMVPGIEPSPDKLLQVTKLYIFINILFVILQDINVLINLIDLILGSLIFI